MNNSDLFWQTYLNLEKEILDIAKYIHFTDHKTIHGNGHVIIENCTSQLDSFSPYIADLLIRTCIEIEAISKELYFEYGGTKTRGNKDLFFDEDCLKLIDQKLGTHKKVVCISCSLFDFNKNENLYIKPLREAHKRQGTDWERAYQSLKHDRFYSLHKGSIKHLLHAMGALYLLNIYYKDYRFSTRYLDVGKIDFSLGSTIFSVKRPSEDYIINVINNKNVAGIMTSDESPFILKYTDSCYKQIIEANENKNTSLTTFILSQSEFSDPVFLKQLEKANKEAQLNRSKNVMLLWELCKYRLNKRIPDTLPFEERKKLFVSSPEWKGTIRQNNSPKKIEEITIDNIQEEIDKAGIHAGMELQIGFEHDRFQKAFNEGYCELILDKGNIQYK